MNRKDFWEDQTEPSLVKATIVNKYFGAWAKVIIPVVKKRGDAKIAYVDLFAGRGRYDNSNEPSTPLLILNQAIHDTDLCQMLVTIFNDKDQTNAQLLAKEIDNLPGIEQLNHRPAISSHEVGDDIIKEFKQIRLIPSLFFIDPWGYKGISLDLINVVIKDWGCDCILFFNYNRINPGLNNPFVKSHMDSLFGQQRAETLRNKLQSMRPSEREVTIVEEICTALREASTSQQRYVLPFRFKNENGTRTSHHLIFISKHIRGYEIMKDIMAKESSRNEQGVPSFEYNPANINQPFLFNFFRPLDELESLLLQHFAGRTLTMKEVYEQHHVDTPYIEKNYKEALRNLEQQGKIVADPPADKRRKGTFADTVKVTFAP